MKTKSREKSPLGKKCPFGFGKPKSREKKSIFRGFGSASEGVRVKASFFKKIASIPSQAPSPSVKIQIMGGKVCFRCKGKTLLGIVNKLFISKVC